MINRHLLWLLPLIVLQSGCALLSPSYSEGQTQIDQWVKEKQYGRALKALNSVDPKDPHYLEAAEKRKQVEVLAAAYEHDIRQQNNQRLKQGDWAGALDSYDDALDRLPDSVVLKDGLAQLHRKQSEELERLELKRLRTHGDWLKETLPIYRDIARVDPRNRYAQDRLDKMQREAEDVADNLAIHGNRALANNNLDKAENLLGLAADLSDAPAIQESLKQLHAKQVDANQRERSARQKRLARQQAAEQRRQREIKSLLSRFDQAFNKREYSKARNYLRALAKANLATRRYRTLENKLDRAIEQESSRLFETGVNAYSRGKYSEAAKYWRQVLELQPNNKRAQENLERAERVINKLQQLKKKQHSN